MSDTAALAEAFGTHFGGAPTLLARAPGRVNLIGEHTDYNDLPVLPMALQRGVSLALRPRDDGQVNLVNLDARFDRVSYEIGVQVDQSPTGHWANYAKAPAQELAHRFAIYRGFDGVVASDLPLAAGLSSSSALVNAVGLALATLGEVGLEPLDLARVMAEAERYTGTRGGAMDQAISMAARPGYAARIDFDPLRMRHLLLPEDWRFVVANTGVRAEKSGSAQAAYNQRRVECSQALKAVAEALARERAVAAPPSSYPELLRAAGSAERSIDVARAVLDPTLLKRFRHVVTEAERVGEAEDALTMAAIVAFGALMDASHASLRADYLVSSAELDALAALALEGGAMGARLTGAGFGGCIVALADVGTVEGVVEQLLSATLPSVQSLPLEDRVIVAVPSGGASMGPFPD